ncbi:hypothetical protein LCM20_09920 [Halobacillus litoralis]|uniref:hypothetical protein n=1 Tax=Halobacillus litoralis TaxID=45668 RepID=UPI001CD7CA45|nr:hypothetical protein [Halobacillus litoralis]MCA0970907.1 hypothetical protein [Halobacillus litoralis]
MEGLVVDRKKYKMVVQEREKAVKIQVYGLIRSEDATQYMTDFEYTIGQVSKRDYTLVVDATYQTTVPSSVLEQLDQTLVFYTTLGFKNVQIVNPNSKIAQVQLRNALERIDFSGSVIS